jgi:DNA-binding XRE family transcriptional regulator
MMVYLVADGEQVLRVREQEGMSQWQLAAAAGVSKKTVTG